MNLKNGLEICGEVKQLISSFFKIHQNALACAYSFTI